MSLRQLKCLEDGDNQITAERFNKSPEIEKTVIGLKSRSMFLLLNEKEEG